MRTPIQYQPRPYILRSNVIFFHDWRYVHEGIARWMTESGENIERYPDELQPETVRWRPSIIPSGIRLRALPSQTSDPFMQVESPWEEHLRHPTVVHEGGLYRLWYSTRKYVCYAESEDGTNWRRPNIGLQEVDDNKANNILFGSKLPPEKDYFNIGNVFVDPSAPSHEKYKAFYQRNIDREVVRAHKERYPSEISPQYQEGADEDLAKTILAVGGAVSPDGIQWKPYTLPLVVHRADTQNIAYYDTVLKKYVGYFRTHVFRRRSIGRAETEDFSHFPLPDTIITPDPSMEPSEVWYAIGRVSYPGASDYHLMFCQKWRVSEDSWYHQLATSPDGVLWGTVPGEGIITRGEGRSWNAGAVAVGAGMVELPDDRVGLPIVGYHVPHKYPRARGLGKFAWASWQKDRIVALEAAEHGEFTTKQVVFQGNTLRLNVRTKHVGDIRVEVLNWDRQPIEGRTFSDCDFISGDYLDRVVTWRGNPDIGREPNEPVAFRVKLSYGQLFSMRFE